MPRNFDDYVYPQPGFHKDSVTLAHLRDEAASIPPKYRAEVSPYIVSILEARDRVIYGNATTEDWRLLTGGVTLKDIIGELPDIIEERLREVFPALLQKALDGIAIRAEGQKDEASAASNQQAEELVKALGGEVDWAKLLEEEGMK